MKGKNLSIMAMIAAVFCSCGQQPAQERGPRPVKLAEVTSLSRIEKSYSGVVSPDQFSDLAFKMSGPLVAMNVLEGQRVKKGFVSCVQTDGSLCHIHLAGTEGTSILPFVAGSGKYGLMILSCQFLQRNPYSI